jgi:hypothetical protein
MYTMVGIAASGVLFGFARYFSRGTPRTMTQEYQEATNEYLKVSKTIIMTSWRTHDMATIPQVLSIPSLSTNNCRASTSSPSPDCPPKATRARVKCKASQPHQRNRRKAKQDGCEMGVLDGSDRKLFGRVQQQFSCVGCSKTTTRKRQRRETCILLHATTCHLYKDRRFTWKNLKMSQCRYQNLREVHLETRKHK